MGDKVNRALPRLETAQLDGYLKKLYYDEGSSGGFSTPQDLYHAAKKKGEYWITIKQVKDWLQTQESYTTFKTVRRRFDRPKLVVSQSNWQWDVDMLNMTWYRKWNRDYGYVLVCVDIFTRYAFTRPLLSLRAGAVKDAFDQIFQYNEKPKTIRSDRGSEFLNGTMKSYFREMGIHHFPTNNEIKTSHCERLIKTIRLRIGRMIRGKRSFTWVDYLPSLTQAYNESVHRSINMTPLNAMCVADKATLWKWQYTRNDAATKTGPNPEKFTLSLNDTVRLSYQSKAFERNYDEKWSKSVYTVTARRMNQGYESYTVKSYDNQPVLGQFSHHELQLVRNAGPERFDIDEVLGEREVGPENAKRREVFVSWMGYNKSYNSWIPAEDVVDLV